MIILSSTAQTRQIHSAFTALGVNPPKAIVEAHDLADRVLTANSYLLKTDHGSLAGAVATALEAGTDPASDPDVQRVITCSAFTESLSREVESIVNERLTATYRQHSDAVVKALLKPFDAAAAKMQAAHDVLGSVDIRDTASVLGRGGDAPQAWSDATNASTTLDTIRTAWVALASLVRQPPEPHFFILQTADVEPRVWLDKQLKEQKWKPWQLVCEGIALSLPTMTEYRARIARMVAAQDREQQENLIAGRGYHSGKRDLSAMWTKVSRG